MEDHDSLIKTLRIESRKIKELRSINKCIREKISKNATEICENSRNDNPHTPAIKELENS